MGGGRTVEGRKRGRRREKENGREWSTPVEVSRQVQAQPAPGATTLRIRPRVWTFRSRLPAGVHTFLRAGHTRARTISWKRSLARQRRVTMTSEATWTVAACARQTWKVLFFTPLPTHARTHAYARARAHTTPVDRIHRGDLWPRMNFEGSSGFIGSRWKKNRVQCSLSSGYGEEAWTRKRNFSFYFILFFNRRE